MFLSPNRPAHRSVLLILVVCAAAAAFAGIYKSQPVASASASRKTSAAPRALENSVLTPASTIVVNSTADVQNNSDGLCTLREAITAANTDTASGATAGECVAGSGSDTIDLTGVLGTITLTSALPFINSDITINGPGANQLTVARSTAGGTPRFGIFAVSSQPLTVNISGLSITNGHTLDGANGADGGGISNGLGATLNLTNMVIHGNTTGSGDPGSGGSGGGVFNFGIMTITSSTISGNTTGTGGTDPGAFGGYGGGISNAGTLTLINTTVSGNTTGISASPTRGGYGAGIYNTINRTVTLSNCTVSDNQAGPGGLGGGIRNEGTAVLKDTIVANNAVSGTGTGPDLSGSFDSQDFNLIENISGASFTGVTTHNITGVDPLLGSLGSYGGSTSTHPLLFGSPAIDAANSLLTTDQRG